MNSPFLKLCHLLLSITFWILLIISILGLTVDLFSKTAQIEINDSSSFGGFAHHNTGYPIIVMPNISTHRQTFKTDGIKVITERQLKLNFNFNEEIINNKKIVSENAWLYVKPKYGSIHILAGMKYYATAVLLVLIFWYSKKLVKLLIKQKHFKLNTIRCLKILSTVILVYFFSNIFFDILIGFQIDYFELQTIKNGEEINGSRITFNPSINFKWIYLVLSLIGLGSRKLLIHGLDLKTENDLTI